MLLAVFLLSASLVRGDTSDNWCGASSNLCSTHYNGLTNLACGFCRSWTLASCIAGNVLRLNGLDSGALPGDSSSSRNYVAYASLDQPFDLTNGSAWSLQTLPSTVPNTREGALWPSQDNATIYSYGGRAPDAPDAPIDTSSLPQYNVASQSWSVPVGQTVEISRLVGGVQVNIPEAQVAYYLGGFQSELTSQAITDGQQHYATSMIEFNTTTKAIKTYAADSVLPAQYGALTYLPYGTDGILLFFGGEKPSSSVVEDCSNCTIVSEIVFVITILTVLEHLGSCVDIRQSKSDVARAEDCQHDHTQIGFLYFDSI